MTLLWLQIRRLALAGCDDFEIAAELGWAAAELADEKNAPSLRE